MDLPVWIGAAIAVLGLLGGWFVRTPKESLAELERRTTAEAADLERRLAVVEARQNQLAADYAGVHGRHDEALKSLTAAVTRLTDRFDAYMGNVNGHARQRG